MAWPLAFGWGVTFTARFDPTPLKTMLLARTSGGLGARPARVASLLSVTLVPFVTVRPTGWRRMTGGFRDSTRTSLLLFSGCRSRVAAATLARFVNVLGRTGMVSMVTIAAAPLARGARSQS